jgi:hypothetical protein
MMIVSFAKTTPAILARRKSVTRRKWKESHAQRFSPGTLFQIYSNGPHRGGKHIGVGRIVNVTKDSNGKIADLGDWEREGFAYLNEHRLPLGKNLMPGDLWREWLIHGTEGLYRVEFEIVTLESEQN